MYNVVVIGGGIVGLASALKIKEKNPNYKVAVIEKERTIAQHQTGHNSGVIHSGLYYKPDSFKAKNCVDGYNMLIDFCNEEEIPYELCGKIVVATKESQLGALNTLHERGQANGLKGIKKLTAEELKEYEPHVAGVSGLYVPQTGIIDYKLVADKYAEKFKHFGGEIFSSNKLVSFKEERGFIHVHTENERLTTRVVVNCSGLYTDKIAKLSGAKIDYKIVPFRGEYYKIKPEKEHLVKNLIYPVPDPSFPFLGVHFTRHIDGGIEAGPNAVLAFAREGYKKSQINMKELMGTLFYPGFMRVAYKYWKTGFGEMYRSYSKGAFTKALQELIPEIQKRDLVKGGAGVRAQACDRKGGLIDDFLVVEHDKFINVGNAPSPAATSSLAIGDRVAQMAIERLK
ncbi:L-2-hydroxyglutarate oxidase [Ekhidna lutea]|uniref:L-2-hydroxyglutarate oxidase n=1 Tax=Ekhidna lutea TaxID=447679 RepID=A0A239LM81_EKHLU|nr:L-2-hydroxyglutarate oxidase [Ekhidna lutea]SNT30779.1 L-2-hydroxyglutarate oxidase [Ekhidna lutea]